MRYTEELATLTNQCVSIDEALLCDVAATVPATYWWLEQVCVHFARAEEQPDRRRNR